MKRRTNKLARIFFNTLTAISLLLALATAGLWGLSGVDAKRYHLVNPARFDENGNALSVQIGCARGTAFVRFIQFVGLPFAWNSHRGWIYIDFPFSVLEARNPWLPPSWMPSTEGNPPFSFGTGLSGVKKTTRVFYLPLWIPLVLTAVLPSRALRRMLRRKPPSNHCPACGYDTRANPSRCSECGHEIAVANKTSID